ncbi:MAG: hypothetical protein DLM70_02200 [Chloroflexi bacterium]|nr:MAG: hypothetical protein DLM70_02200 [Chloroflexota bacterium]
MTGVIQHVFKAVPDGCVGAGIWGSPTVDAATGIIYVATGNPIAPVNCATKTAFYGQSLVALNASDLSVAAAWQIPSSQGIDDGDFGSTPTLFTAMLNGQPRNLVGIVNKNGIYYAFDRSNIATGPVWESTVSVAGGAPDSGLGAITPSAWDGHYLYIAGGNETLNGVSCPSVLQALDPPSGAPVWQTCLSTGPVLGAVTVVPGVVEVGAGREIILADAASGNVLYTYVNAAVTDDKFQAAGSISNGVLYQGDTQGYIYAWAPVTTSIHTTASLSGTSFCGLYTEPVTVTLSATDTGGTIAGTSYQIGQGPVTTYTGPFQVSGSGNHTVTFHSTDTNGSVEPTRTLAFATGPLIGLSTVKGGYGTNVPVSGSTFQPGETVKVHWDSSATTPLATATATSACAVSTSFLVPQATLGNHHVIAVGQSSHRSATASFQVKPAVALNPSAARQGTRISVSSYNFQPGEIVNVYWNSIGGTSLGSGTAGSNGTVPAISITVPQAPYGFYKVFAVGATSGAYGSQPFKVMPMLTVSPPSGAAGSPATVSGNGFGANETVTILWDCSTYACTGSTALGTVVTDAAGNFGGSSKIPPVTIVIPKNATHVTHTLAGKGTVNSFDFRTATYRVTS